MARPRATSDGRGAVSGARADRIVRVAADLFLERGYESVSMDDIVHVVGGSKGTLYAYVGSKERLLHSVVEMICREVTVSIDVPEEGTLVEQAHQVGYSFASLVLSERVQRFYRLIASVGRSFPEAGRAFYDAGPRVACTIFSDWIAGHQRTGSIRADIDPYRLAVIFHDMLIGDGLLSWLSSTDDNDAVRARLDATVALAAEVLVRGCGAEASA